MTRQLNLFEIKTYNTVVRDVKASIAELVKSSGLSREQALDRINDMAAAHGVRLMKGNGERISMETWEKWLNQQDATRVPPIKALPIICAALGGFQPLQPIVEAAGGRLIDDNEARLLDWAKAYHKAKNAREEMRQLETQL